MTTKFKVTVTEKPTADDIYELEPFTADEKLFYMVLVHKHDSFITLENYGEKSFEMLVKLAREGLLTIDRKKINVDFNAYRAEQERELRRFNEEARRMHEEAEALKRTTTTTSGIPYVQNMKTGVIELQKTEETPEKQSETVTNLSKKERKAEIVHLLKEGKLKQVEIANRFGVSQAVVSYIKKAEEKKAKS